MRIYTHAKKCLLAAILIAGTTFSASAQKYSFFNGNEATETATAQGEEVAVHLKLRNNTLDTFQLTWQMLENTFSAADWDMVAMCDPYLCHNDIPSTFSPFVYPNATADSVTEFKALATPKSSASVAHMKLVVFETANPEHKDTITLTIDARTVGLKAIACPGKVIDADVYPNPARNLIYFNADNFSSRNLVEIFNYNGQQLLSADLYNAGNTVNIESLPKGFYILKLTEQNGKVKISKFSKL